MTDSIDLMKLVSDGVDNAKAGRAVEMYQAIYPYFERGALSLKSHYAFGWIIYYALHQSGDAKYNERKEMLAAYLRLSVARPHKLHSMILTEAIRLYKNISDSEYALRAMHHPAGQKLPSFSIVRFMDLWQLSNLREGDWRRKTIDGNLTPSTTEKLITHYVDELTSNTELSISKEFRAVLEKALTLYPDSANLLAQYAAVCCKSEDAEKGVDYLRRAILISPSKSYLWHRLAGILPETANPRLKIAILYKALAAPGPEDFKGRIRIGLAMEMAEAGAWQQALYELEKVKTTYEANGWKMPGDYRKLMERMPEGTRPEDPSGAYRKIAHLAEEFIYESLPTKEASKSYHKPADPKAIDRNGRPKPRPVDWRVTDAEGQNYWFTPAQHSIPEELPHGTRVAIRVVGNRIVKAELAENK